MQFIQLNANEEVVNIVWLGIEETSVSQSVSQQ